MTLFEAMVAIFILLVGSASVLAMGAIEGFATLLVILDSKKHCDSVNPELVLGHNVM